MIIMISNTKMLEFKTEFSNSYLLKNFELGISSFRWVYIGICVARENPCAFLNNEFETQFANLFGII